QISLAASCLEQAPSSTFKVAAHNKARKLDRVLRLPADLIAAWIEVWIVHTRRIYILYILPKKASPRSRSQAFSHRGALGSQLLNRVSQAGLQRLNFLESLGILLISQHSIGRQRILVMSHAVQKF